MIKPRPVKELLELYSDGILKVRPEFQRRPNWPLKAKRYFVDTVLRGYPSPLIYLRFSLDRKSKQGHMEVVDGQQRLISLIEFAENKWALDNQTREFDGLRFSELEPPDREQFLYYPMPVEELANANDDYVLEVFHRINNFGNKLNSQELRHGKFVGDNYEGIFRLAVIDASRRWGAFLWDDCKVVSLAARSRMADDELVAQLFGVLLEGVHDGGQPYINKLYETHDHGFPDRTNGQLDEVIKFIADHFGQILEVRKLRGAPHFLMLFAAVAHALFGIPKGDMGKPGIPEMPERDPLVLTDIGMARDNLLLLGGILNMRENDVPPKFATFRLASAGTTQRIRSRGPRFAQFYEALLPKRFA